MSLKLAIVGANGFIGSRAVELFHLRGLAEVRPIVRSLNSLARLSRFDLDCRVADARDQSALRAALEGCDGVIHSVSGDPAMILGSLAPVYLAAQQAGVKRFVYLSSASVHGQAPLPGTDESSPLNDRQPIAYNTAKVRAERRLLRLRETGAVELIILRPGIVVGPRSYWITSFASGLPCGSAYLVNHGRGICNSIYVDNLIHAIYLAATVPQANGHAFLVGDDETISWAELYRPIADALGFDLSQVCNLEYVKPRLSWRSLLHRIQSSAAARRIVPRRLRQVMRALLAREGPPASPWAYSGESAGRVIPAATLEMALLQRCAYKLPHAKAKRLLGYEPIVPFAEACRRTIDWLEFSGYAVPGSSRIRTPASNAPGG
jgi:nucleoside-diphosphate-sugar epimerase